MEGRSVTEGFLCPVCIKDLGSIGELQSHFELVHGQSDPDIVQSFLEFVNKTKQRLRRDGSGVNGGAGAAPDEPNSPVFQPFIPYIYRPPHWHSNEQTAGVVRCHRTVFCRLREARVAHCHANRDRLALRLHRLVTGMPTSPADRLAFERSVVAWVADELVNQCPGCGCTFGLSLSARVGVRRHHCRVCGYVLCGECCSMVSLREAAALTPDLICVPTDGDSVASNSSGGGRMLAKAADGVTDVVRLTIARRRALIDSLTNSRLRRANSSDSLDSSVSVGAGGAESGGERDHWKLRMCRHCLEELTKRRWHHNRSAQYSQQEQVYARLMESKRIIGDLITEHNDKLLVLMNEAQLSADQSPAEQLKVINQLRRTLLTRVERLELMTREFASTSSTADAQEDSEPRRGRFAKLQDRVHAAIDAFIRTEVLVNLQRVPSEQELIDMRCQARE